VEYKHHITAEVGNWLLSHCIISFCQQPIRNIVSYA